ncbi:MAG: cytochrome c [bacterium]
MKSTSDPRARAALLVTLALVVGCRQRMADQPAPRPLTPSNFFADGQSSRSLVEGAVARGDLNEDEALYTGKSGGQLVEEFPIGVTREMLTRGHERFDIYCSPCHDRVGEGKGVVVQRGYAQPPSFHTARLREARPGYVFDVISHGFGRMPAYGPQIPVQDRWAIVAYLKALQRSQNAKVDDVPASERTALLEAPKAAAAGSGAATHGEHP